MGTETTVLILVVLAALGVAIWLTLRKRGKDDSCGLLKGKCGANLICVTGKCKTKSPTASNDTPSPIGCWTAKDGKWKLWITAGTRWDLIVAFEDNGVSTSRIVLKEDLPGFYQDGTFQWTVEMKSAKELNFKGRLMTGPFVLTTRDFCGH